MLTRTTVGKKGKVEDSYCIHNNFQSQPLNKKKLKIKV